MLAAWRCAYIRPCSADWDELKFTESLGLTGVAGASFWEATARDLNTWFDESTRHNSVLRRFSAEDAMVSNASRLFLKVRCTRVRANDSLFSPHILYADRC